MFVLVSSELITKLGMYVLLPIFIAFLFFIMYDISKKNNAGKQGTFWIFLALGGGFFGFLIKMVLEWYFSRTL
ncbi:MAG: DUF2788 domain-containing protein [Moraxella sp.]|jgi:FtsH-binding integral membrane protein|uniref:DUF2788 domain-containing protein n=3 Tax=Pseudomonadota TaxID=1224 RepID=A0A0X8K6J5_FAUOS|nr:MULTISPECIES: DUF2788 domain-containing protein [Pseudomonadota]EEV21728.1 hypothetical protein ENHAE0001_2050 [Enhydrobacter aerosaccus SK60]NOX78253.1 DUF2788 domain-containing protein [Gammaproteobacteria bacterium]ONG39057.1 hypothetical protein BKE17_06555 [Enhydrobacter sp. H5]RVU82569.1 DUF2788 domain-containing protein [Leucothrix sargassi]TGP46564.1 DUF2788 domain-containing protein [bacterium M00.F.Ca.ET.230.01.1.1]VWX30421.1 conserved hypothetical protein [Moraxellaceae bacteriu